MERIYVIGDPETAAAFRLGGVSCVVSGKDRALRDLGETIARDDAGIVMITREFAGEARDLITRCNLTMARPVIVEIPGVRDAGGFGRSIMSYVAEALGISIQDGAGDGR